MTFFLATLVARPPTSLPRIDIACFTASFRPSKLLETLLLAELHVGQGRSKFISAFPGEVCGIATEK